MFRARHFSTYSYVEMCQLIVDKYNDPSWSGSNLQPLSLEPLRLLLAALLPS